MFVTKKNPQQHACEFRWAWTPFPRGALRPGPAPCIPPLCAHAAGILPRTSCSSSRAKVCPQEWLSSTTANFVDVLPPRASPRPRIGFKDRKVGLKQHLWDFRNATFRRVSSRSLECFVPGPRGECAPRRSLAVLRAWSWSCPCSGGSSAGPEPP